jgi:hypothetical protein
MKTNKILLTALIMTLSLSLIFVGCKQTGIVESPVPSDTPVSTNESPSAPSNQGITVNRINFTEIDAESLDSTRAQLINDMSLTRGYTYWTNEDGTYTVFIGLGERATAGYGIKVLSVEDNEGNTNILVEETKPGKDDMVAQVITYPYVIIQMGGITDNFNIADTEGNSFEVLYGENLSRHMVVCTYEGLIDGTSIEATMDGQPAFFRNDQMASKVDGLNEGTLVTIVYTTNDEGQMILESIVHVESGSESYDATGIYQGLIDGNSIEVLVDGVYMALRNTEVEAMTEGLKKDEAVIIEYTVSSEGQFLLISISPSK